MNYKDVVNRIQTIVEDHKMLVDFGYGQVSDIKTRAQGTEGEVNDADYPYLFLNPTQHVRTQQQITYNFNMIVMDMAREEEAHEYQNFLNIQSDCIQYIDDVVARLYYFYKDKPEVSMDLNYTPFYERFQDDLAGATATLSIVVPNSINECLAPFTPVPTPPASCLPTLPIFSDSQNEFQYTRDPDDITRNWRWEDNTQEDLLIGNFADQYFSNAVTGDFEFYLTQVVTFIEPAAGEVLPARPVLSSLEASYLDIEPTCDSGNWPTVWSADPITYIAKYNVTLPTLTNFGVLGFEDPAANESAIVQEIGGTLSIGFDGVAPQPVGVIYDTVYTGGYNGNFTTLEPSDNDGGPFLFNETTFIDPAYLTSSANMRITPLVDTYVKIEFVMTSKNRIDQTLIDAQPLPFFDTPTPAMRLTSGTQQTGFTFYQEDAWDFDLVVGDEFIVTNTFELTLLAGVEYGYGFSTNPSNTTIGGDPLYNKLADWSNVKYTITLATAPPSSTKVLDASSTAQHFFKPEVSGNPQPFPNTILDTYAGMRPGPANYYSILADGTWTFTMTGTAQRTTDTSQFPTGFNLNSQSGGISLEADITNWPTNPALGVNFDFELTWTDIALTTANGYVAWQTLDEPPTEDEGFTFSGTNITGYYTA